MSPSTRAGEYLLHPAVWISIAVLVINDHFLKPAYGGWMTGKLSDFAGMVFFPLIAAGLFDIGAHLLRRPLNERGRRRLITGAVIATALVFGSMQVSELAGDAFRYGLAAIQWPVRALVSLARGAGAPGLTPVGHTADPSDLVALAALVIPLWIGLRRAPRS